MKNRSKAYSFSQATSSTLLTKQTRKKSQHMQTSEDYCSVHFGQNTLIQIGNWEGCRPWEASGTS